MREKSPRILLVRLSAVGDVVNTLPALAALRQRFPEAHIAWLVEDKALGVVQGHPLLDEVFVFERRLLARECANPSGSLRALSGVLLLRRRLRRARFDLLLDFHGNLKSALLGSLAGATVRIGYDRKNSREGNFLFSDWQVELPRQRIHRVEKHLALLRAIGIRDAAPSYCFAVAPSARQFAASYLRRLDNGPGPVVILHPGTSEFGAHKRWPPAHFARLADRLVSGISARVLVTHGPGERELARSIARQCCARVDLPETASLHHLAALIERASVFVSADTGPMHLAAALQVPVVALFGPKDPVVYGPYGTRSKVLTSALDCCPCGGRHCDDPVCMRSVTPEHALDAVLELVGSAQAPCGPGDSG